ncbi:response regulator transcription factor [Litorilituus lipolyticus]|nr:response regulator transcription factor [Litorilituus lipolyticus]
MSNEKHIIIIEDDIMLADLTQNFLEQNQYKVTVFNSANAFLDKAQSLNIDIIICDINLPEMNGFELCELSRKRYNGPFVFLTARKDDADHIQGLSIGADDYINKPVKPPLLLARIKAALRTNERNKSDITSNCIKLENLTIDKDARLLSVNSKPIPLTSDELDLLWLFIAKMNKTLSRDDLFLEVIGRQYDGQDRVIDARVSRLRKKFNAIEDNPYEIKTIWRKGYTFASRGLPPQ